MNGVGQETFAAHAIDLTSAFSGGLDNLIEQARKSGNKDVLERLKKAKLDVSGSLADINLAGQDLDN